jgi:hypothetical protein
VLIKPQLAAPKQEAKARIELKRCRLFTSTMSKNPTERFKLRHRNITRLAVFTGKLRNSWSLNLNIALFIQCNGLVNGRQRQTHFDFGFGTARAILPNKVRLQQAISEQSVIIVTRLLYCSRRIQ